MTRPLDLVAAAPASVDDRERDLRALAAFMDDAADVVDARARLAHLRNGFHLESYFGPPPKERGLGGVDPRESSHRARDRELEKERALAEQWPAQMSWLSGLGDLVSCVIVEGGSGFSVEARSQDDPPFRLCSVATRLEAEKIAALASSLWDWRIEPRTGVKTN